MKTLGDEWYVVIMAYKLTIFDILRDFFVLPYIACPCYPYIRVYRLYDRLMDYWDNVDIVKTQYEEMQAKANLGEKVVRDSITLSILHLCNLLDRLLNHVYIIYYCVETLIFTLSCKYI